MAKSREWDVAVGARVENVTNHEDFPELLRIALGASEDLSVIQLNLPTVPHTTSVIVRVVANSKAEAERRARDVVLRAIWVVTRAIIGDQAIGWTMTADAGPAQSLPKSP